MIYDQSITSAGPMPKPTVELLDCLGYIYLKAGQPHRAIILFLLAVRNRPNARLMAALALALIEADMGSLALPLFESLEKLDRHFAQDPRVSILRARALLANGDDERARALFAASCRARGDRQVGSST